MANKLFMYDGVKSSMIWDDNSPAWENISGGQYSTSRSENLAPVYRGVNMIGNDVARMPFLVRKGKDVIDSSQDYANVLEFLPDPRRLFKQLSVSLDTTGSAYALPIVNKAGYIKDLRYLAPGTIDLDFDERTGTLNYLTRTINSQPPVKYKPGIEILYFWLADSRVEIGPPTVFPLRSAQAAAEVLYNLDTFVSKYFERGMIRPIIVSVEGDPPDAERERMENWFNSLWSGIRNAFRLKIFRSGTVKIEQIGDGLDQLQNQSLSNEKRKDIALALGIPYALLFSEAANFATLQGDTKFYYQNTVEPRCELIAEGINSQLFHSSTRYKDITLEFTPESLDIYQTDEGIRATSLNTYVKAGVPLLVACEILGIELSEEQRAQIEQISQQQVQDQDYVDIPEASALDLMLADLAKWRRKSLKAIRAKKPALVEFDTDIIPRALQMEVRGKLKRASSAEDVIGIFNGLQQAESNISQDAQEITSAIIALTQAMEHDAE